MRWKIEAPPKEGDWRRLTVFAWLPTQVEDYMVWLETYYIKEQLIAVADLDEGFVHRELQWVEYERGLLYNY